MTVSLTLGIHLQTGEALLDLYYLKDVFEAMGENTLPDTGMPKPQAEFLVTGSFYSPGSQPVTGGEVKAGVGTLEKPLYVFGPRRWRAGMPSAPERISSLPLDYTQAFGGKGYEKNPDGLGYEDGFLPCIEHPKTLVTSRSHRPEPAGLGPLNPMLPQRMQYQGTYNEDYLKKYYPGYPPDHDWNYFLCAPSDQWNRSFFRGDESFALHHMHPEHPCIQGKLPGFFARCFITQKKSEDEVFAELPLNLDTIWFFPDKLTGLLIFRGVLEVLDDEGQEITHILCAYEDRSQQSRNLEYYKQALKRRRSSDDALLTNLKTGDLIPAGHKSAMELLMDTALNNDEQSEFARNMDAKADALQKMADEKTEQALQQVEEQLENLDIPEEAWEQMSEETRDSLSGPGGKLDIRNMMRAEQDQASDPDLAAFNNKLESALPGITSGDPRQMDFKDFSFDSIDEIMQAVDEFSGKKEKEAKELAAKELGKAKQELKIKIEGINQQIDEAVHTAGLQGQADELRDARQKMQDSLAALESIDLNGAEKKLVPLPRINSEEIKATVGEINPRVTEALQHVESMKAMGYEDEATRDLDRQVREMLESSQKRVEEALLDMENSFKEGYLMGAHFMDEGISPHKESVATVRERFLEAFISGVSLAERDWACIDLSGEVLDGVDLSGAYLEQVDFQGASLRGAIFKGAILARANLSGADLTGADLRQANLGAVRAHETLFAEADLKEAVLSRGDFTGADFTRAALQDIQTLEICIDRAGFLEANMPAVMFLEVNITGARFDRATLDTSAFMQCRVQDCDFTGAILNRSVFVNTDLLNVEFENAGMANACFVATEQEMKVKNVSFRRAVLQQANFQNMPLQEALFTGANLENAFFGGADLTSADLSWALAKNAQFRKAKLTHATLNDINLMQGSLAKAHLTGASFQRANLFQVDFLRSTITDTDFKDSNMDSTLIENWRPR